MKVSSCIKKVEKALGVPCRYNGNRFSAEYEGHIISFLSNGYRGSEPEALEGDAVNFHVRRLSDHSDPYTDYHAGSFRSNITQLIHAVKPPGPKFPVGSLVRGKGNKRATRQGYAGKMGVVTSAGSYSRIDWLGEDRKTMYNTYPERDLELVSAVAS